MSKKGTGAINPVTTGLAGLAIGFFACWYMLVMPMTGWIDSREQAVQEWERINRQEREAIQNIKTMNIEQLKSWVATVGEQNTRFAELQSLLHKQERQIYQTPSLVYVIAFILSALAFGFVYWMIRDTNLKSEITLQNAISVLPALEDAIREQRAVSIETGTVASLPDPRLEAIENGGSNVQYGTIVNVWENKGYGFISPSSGESDVYFKLSGVSAPQNKQAKPNTQVSFELEVLPDGRSEARNVQIM